MLESVLIVITAILMVVAILIAFIPNIPGPAIVWAMGAIFAALTGFDRVPILVLLLMTVFMVIGSTTEIWLRYLGMSSRGGSCLGAIGSLIGGILGTIYIPIPILGTLIGAVIGALLVELIYTRQTEQALMAGRAVIETYFASIVVEFLMSSAIFITFLVSVWWTA